MSLSDVVFVFAAQQRSRGTSNEENDMGMEQTKH